MEGGTSLMVLLSANKKRQRVSADSPPPPTAAAAAGGVEEVLEAWHDDPSVRELFFKLLKEHRTDEHLRQTSLCGYDPDTTPNGEEAPAFTKKHLYSLMSYALNKRQQQVLFEQASVHVLKKDLEVRDAQLQERARENEALREENLHVQKLHKRIALLESSLFEVTKEKEVLQERLQNQNKHISAHFQQHLQRAREAALEQINREYMEAIKVLTPSSEDVMLRNKLVECLDGMRNAVAMNLF